MRMHVAALSAIAALALGAAACTEAGQDNARTDADAAAARTGEATEDAGSALKEEAAQIGSAVKAGAKEVAQEIDETTDRLAVEADKQEAETARDTRGN